MVLRFFRHWRSSYSGIPRAIWFLAAVGLINRIGAMVIPFMTLYLTQELHFEIRQAGYVMGCFGIGAFLGSYLGGRLTDKFGYFRVQFWSLFSNGLMLLMLMLVHEFWMMCLAVFSLSVVSEIFRPANSMSVASHTDEHTRTRSISLIRMAFNMGWAVAPALAGILAEVSWNLLFWADGISCIIAALLLQVLLSKKAGKQRGVSSAGAEVIFSTTSPYRDRQYLLFLAFTFLGALVFMQFLWTVPVFFKEAYHWKESTIGLITALNGIIVFTIEMPLIFRIEKSRPALNFVQLGILFYAASFLSFLILPAGYAAALFFIIAISFGEMFVMPFSSNFAYGRAGFHGKSGQYMALYSMSYSLANIAAPLIGTQIIDQMGYSALWITLVGISGVALMGFWALNHRISGQKAETFGVSNA